MNDSSAQVRVSRGTFLLGFGGIAVVLFLLFLRWPTGNWLQTDFQSLLPTTAHNPWQQQATQQVTSRYERQLILLAKGQNAQHFIDEAVTQLTASGFVNPDFNQQQRERWQTLATVLKPYAGQLIATGDALSLSSDSGAYLERFRTLLYSPVGGPWLNGLATDPMGLFQNMLLAAAPQPLDLGDDTAIGSVEIPQQMVAFDSLAGLYQKYEQLREQAQLQNISFHAVGAPLFTAYGVSSGRSEISTIGLASLFALVLLLWFSLRSAQGLLLTLVSVLVGMSVGLAATLIVFQQIHLLALVFGVTLIGIAADYSLHYLCHSLLPHWRADQGMKEVAGGLKLGVASSVLGFSVLLLLPFPALQQVGVFMACGLLGSFATVWLLFPSLYRGPGSAAVIPAIFEKVSFQFKSKHWFALLLLPIVIVPGIMLLQPVDEVRDFYAAPAKLQEDQHQILNISGRSVESRYLLLEAKTKQALLALEEKLVVAVPDLKPGITAIIPSLRRQQQNLSLQREIVKDGELEAHRQSLGVDADLWVHYASELLAPFHPLQLDAIAALDLPLGLGGFIGCDAGQCASWLSLSGVALDDNLEAIIRGQTGVSLVDPVAEINALMADLRVAVAWVLVFAAILIMIFLIIRRGWKQGVAIISLPLGACLFSLAALGYLQGSISIINLLALLLVIAVGLDYAIFLAMSSKESRSATSLAVTLSALTSVLAFGMLGFSETPVISDFGLTIALGLLFAWALYWLARRVNWERQ